jgi:lysylphosphatidylglycerol synthetase-like protein (DUF2156 family)
MESDRLINLVAFAAVFTSAIVAAVLVFTFFARPGRSRVKTAEERERDERVKSRVRRSRGSAFGAIAFVAAALILLLGVILSLENGAHIAPIVVFSVFAVILGLETVNIFRGRGKLRDLGRELRKRGKPTEKTARILGRPHSGFGERKPPGTLERAKQVRAKRMMYRLP